MSMSAVGRRTVLGGAVALATGAAMGVGGATRQAHAADDVYSSNTALYAAPELVEGQDYKLRFRRHAVDGGTVAEAYAFPKTAVLAPHGGGIELGTSELCLAIAGYHPATFEAEAEVHDYWMFEGLRSSGNGELHVTSTHCDDPVARAVAGGSLNVVTLHGCTASQAGAPDADPEAVVVGGGNDAFKGLLMSRLGAAGFQVIDGKDVPSLAGVSPQNIVNRTLLGGGGQLELTAQLRGAMFEANTGAGRATSTTQVFWDFVTATREAVRALEQQ